MNIKFERGAKVSDFLELQYIAKDHITLEVLAASSFAPFDEGLFIACLDRIRRDFKELNISVSFDPNETQQEALYSLLGLRLLDSADALTIRQLKGRPTDDKELERVLDQMWQRIISNRGVIESGHHRYFISREPDYPIPQSLSPSLDGRFPSIEQFIKVISQHITSMVGTVIDLEARDFEGIGSFVYEAAKNAHEHGREDGTGNVIPGYRGVVLEKLRIGNDGTLHASHNLALNMQEYFDSFGGWVKDKHFIGITVVDTGLGIHNTIQKLDKEDEFKRFQRAFWPRVTRKPPSEIGTGLGLTNVLQSVKQCNGFLSAHSAGIVASTWHSKIPMKLDEHESYFMNARSVATDRGTALTLVLPIEKPRHI